MNYFEDESEEVKYEKEYHYLESKLKSYLKVSYGMVVR